MGYADFVEAPEPEPEPVARWFRRLEEDFAVTARDPETTMLDFD